MVAASETDIAVIGMSCRFPGASDPASFWRNLIEGRESITFFSRKELAAAGLASSLYDRRDYVPARGVLHGIERFDAALFDMTPAEAAMTDPQHRLFLECAWEAMEDGGYNGGGGGGFAGPVGVYGGCGTGGYLRDHVLPHAAGTDLAGLYQIMQANEKDFLATRTAYKLHLTGPAITVQTACSTSLVAVHCACQAILAGECDMALAGGVSIFLPQTTGYLYQEGMILSPDGHCRAFDASAGGTVMGSGAGVVLLKRLEDAIHDRDFIYGVIKGSAVNNDGAGKVGFAAPGVDGQVRAIREALAVAGVDSADIGYVETHGTATPMGDPVEIEALGRAFGRTKQRATCLIGSVKTNIGHCDAAAGIAGLIKTLLALRNGRIPPSLHFVQANPAIDFGSSPFRVCTVPTAWPSTGGPRLAGVSSFGMGGTNVHMIVGEAPSRGKLPSRRGCCLLPLSGRTATALGKTAGRLARHIETHPEDGLPDIAFSLQVGRRPLNCRHFIVGGSGQEALAALAKLEELHGAGRDRQSSLAGMVSPAIAFMFPGQGSQHVGMAGEIYAGEKIFRDAMDLCAETLNPLLTRDLRQYLTGSDDLLAEELRQTAIAQPVLFAVEYSYAMLLAAWGIRPQAVIGHSLGEYVAACLAGIFTLTDALRLVAARGTLMQRQPEGMMVAVARSAEELAPLLNADVALAAVNPGSCTLSGPFPAIGELVARFAAEGVAHSVLKTSHAFHSAMFDAAMEEFAAIVATVPRSAPRIPLISNLTGGPLSEREAVDPWYWARHLRHTVRFGDGVNTLLAEPGRLLVEVGPGRTLAGMVLQGGLLGANRKVVAVGCHPRDGVDSSRALLSAVGEMWAFGAPVDWQAMAGDDKAGRLPLPTYPFERQEYWMDAPTRGRIEATAPPTPEGRLSVQQWRRIPHLPDTKADVRDRWILIADPGPVADGIARVLAGRGCRPTMVAPAETSFDSIAGDVGVHLVYLPSLQAPSPSSDLPEQALNFTIALAGALERLQPAGPIFCDILTYGVYDIAGDEQLMPTHAALAAAVHSLSREYPALCCRCLDCGMANTGEPWPESRVETLARELMHPGEQATVALRGGYRWQEYYEPVPPLAGEPGLRRRGTYLITGGLGDIGLSLADHLSRHYQANLVLTRKSPFPAPEEWSAWLAERGENDATSGVIRRLLALREQGSAVMAVAADVASREGMQAVIDRAENRFGRIDGCIHGAGVTGAEAIRPYRELTLDRFAAILSAKLSGYRFLRELMRDRDPDFLIAMSSLSTVLGGSGMGAYGAANAAMAAQIGADNRSGGRWLCVDWDGWRFDERSTHPEGDNDILRYAIPASAGVDHLARLTQWPGGGRIAVSTTDLNDRARRWSSGSPAPRREKPVHQDDDSGREDFSPEEELVAGIWRSVLGTPSIRRHDSFFGLGGSSLQLTQVHSRLKESLGRDFPLRMLFEAPRLADMAELVCRQRGRVAEESPASREELEF